MVNWLSLEEQDFYYSHKMQLSTMCSQELLSERPSIHLWLIDDDCTYRRYVREALSASKDTFILTEFDQCETALKQLQNQEAPDVLLLDISLPGGMSGLRGLELFRHKIPHTPIVIVTVSEANDDVFSAFCHGAHGYVVKSAIADKTLEAVYDAIEGRSFIDSHIAAKILRMHDLFPDLRNKYQLTPTELKILSLIKAGQTRKGVQSELYIAETTFKYHLQNIYSKLQVHSLAEAITKTTFSKPDSNK